jgi:hypothetical protein
MRCAVAPIFAVLGGALIAVACAASAALAQQFRIDDLTSARKTEPERLAPGTIEFSDRELGDRAGAPGGSNETALIPFDEWASRQPAEKKFLALFPGYTEPVISKELSGAESGRKAPYTEKLYMYVAQARFILARPAATIDLSHYVTLAFLQKIDPAINHKVISAADVPPLNDKAGIGNDNPDRKWCTGLAISICIQSSYKLEGKIPIGIMLVNKIRETRKIPDQIDFQSELTARSPSDLDQAGLQEITALRTPIAGVLEQNIFYVNQIMKFGKFLAVFQTHPSDAGKTVVTAFMALAIKASVLDEKREFEKVPVLRNLVPAQVLMGKSSFNSGDSISAGLPTYARNEIKTIASLLQTN